MNKNNSITVYDNNRQPVTYESSLPVRANRIRKRDPALDITITEIKPKQKVQYEAGRETSVSMSALISAVVILAGLVLFLLAMVVI